MHICNHLRGACLVTGLENNCILKVKEQCSGTVLLDGRIQKSKCFASQMENDMQSSLCFPLGFHASIQICNTTFSESKVCIPRCAKGTRARASVSLAKLFQLEVFLLLHLHKHGKPPTPGWLLEVHESCF